MREADVFQTFRAALAKTLDIAPDIVVIAGDLFHSVRPSNLCLQHTFREFMKFRAETGAPVVIIGGNHDSPRSAETGCVLEILTNIPEVYVIHNEYARLDLPQATVFGLCHRALAGLSSLKVEPDASAKHNILAVHGTLEGIDRNFYDSTMISPSQVMRDDWDYVAFGHYHVHTKLADNAYYSGATDYTSFNIWSETDTPKGIVEYDPDNRKAAFHALPTREVIDLRAIEAAGMSASDVNNLVISRVEGIGSGLEGKIVRLVVNDIPRALQADLDFDLVRSFKQEALHFDLQLRAPKAGGSRSENSGDRRPLSLEEEWREFVKLRETPKDVDKDKLLEIGLEYLGREEQRSG